MKLAISNIAWPHDRDADVADALQSLGVSCIEVAPSKVWPNPLQATDSAIAEYRRFWNDRGINIVAAQSLLFGHPELTLFDSAETRQRTLEHLVGVVRVCAQLGCENLVFGSPRNRRVGAVPVHDAWNIAVDFFSALAERAAAERTVVVLEANPEHYGADFIVRAQEAIDLVQRVNHPGFRLHLDSACMTLAHDPVAEVFSAGSHLLSHYHISEKDLAPVGAGTVDHSQFAIQLALHGYSNAVSIEMRESEPFASTSIIAAIGFAAANYLQFVAPRV